MNKTLYKILNYGLSSGGWFACAMGAANGLPWLGLLEIGFGLYCLASFNVYLSAEKYLVGPFLAMYAAGFLYCGLLTILQTLGYAE